MDPLPELGELQLAVMRVLWRRGEATAADVQTALEPQRTLAITTVSTILSRLEKRGLVGHRAEGRLFVYRPRVSEPQVRSSMVRSLVDLLFRGDATALVGQLLDARELGPGDLEKMRALLDAAAAREPRDAR